MREALEGRRIFYDEVKNLKMGGTIQSRYQVGNRSLNDFLPQFEKLGLLVEGGDDGKILKVKRNPDDSREVWIVESEDAEECIDVIWHYPNVGSDRYSLLKSALQIEGLLIDGGSACLFGEVAPFRANLDSK